MFKKDTIKKLLEEAAISKALPILEKEGYQYLKSKNQFVRQDGEFRPVIFISHHQARVEPTEDKRHLNLVFRIVSAIEIPRFSKWLKDKYAIKPAFRHELDNFLCKIQLKEPDLQLLEVYEPTKARQFKSYVTAKLRGVIEEKPVDYHSLLREGFRAVLSKLDQFCDARRLYENRRLEFDMRYMRLLQYFDSDSAKPEFEKFLKFRSTSIDATAFRSVGERKYAIDTYNRLVLDFNASFGQNMPIRNESFRDYVLRQSGETINLGNILIADELFRVTDPAHSIVGFLASGGHIYQAQSNGNLFKLGKDGKLTAVVKLDIPAQINTFGMAHIEADASLMIHNYVVSGEGEVRELEYLSRTGISDTKRFIPFSQVHLPDTGGYAFLITDFKAHEAHLFDEACQPLRVLTLEHKPVEIIPELNLILCEEKDRACVVYDTNGRRLYSMPSNNSQFNYRKGYAYSVKSGLFVAAWYHTKSQVFRLTTGELIKNIWAHPTYIKGYKEQLYGDVSHNFGMHRAKFSPDGSYLVGGAEHGKYVAWDTATFERHELIPNAAYLKKAPQAEVVELDGKEFLRNRGGRMLEIVFIDNGNYFLMQIGTDILLWSRDFNHLDTAEDIGYLKQIDDGTFLLTDGGEYVLYKIRNDK